MYTICPQDAFITLWQPVLFGATAESTATGEESESEESYRFCLVLDKHCQLLLIQQGVELLPVYTAVVCLGELAAVTAPGIIHLAGIFDFSFRTEEIACYRS